MTGTPAAASGASRTACERMVTIAVYSSTSAIAPGGPGRCPGKLQSRTTSDRAPIASACRIGTLATRPVTPAARARRYPVGLECTIVALTCVFRYQLEQRAATLVFARKPAEDLLSADPVLSEVDLRGRVPA